MKRLPIFLLSLFLPALACGQKPATTQPLRIAVLASFPEELEAIKQQLGTPDAPPQTTMIHGMKFQTLDVGGKHYVLLVTGMSLVNAAMNTQLLLDHFAVSAVTFSGIAGGIDPSFGVGDVVVPARWHYHGETAYFNETAPGQFGLADFFKPKYANFGMIFPEDATVKREGSDGWKQQASFDADAKLLALAQRIKMPEMKFGERVCQVVVGGDGVSGTVFCDNAAYRKFVFDVWKAECLDMESTAIAHVCWENKTPVLIVRGLSDLAGGQHGKNTVDDYLNAAATDSAKVLAAILREMS